MQKVRIEESKETRRRKEEIGKVSKESKTGRKEVETR